MKLTQFKVQLPLVGDRRSPPSQLLGPERGADTAADAPLPVRTQHRRTLPLTKGERLGGLRGKEQATRCTRLLGRGTGPLSSSRDRSAAPLISLQRETATAALLAVARSGRHTARGTHRLASVEFGTFMRPADDRKS